MIVHRCPVILKIREHYFANRPVAAKQVMDKAFFNLLGNSFGCQQMFYIEQVAWMLTV